MTFVIVTFVITVLSGVRENATLDTCGGFRESRQVSFAFERQLRPRVKQETRKRETRELPGSKHDKRNGYSKALGEWAMGNRQRETANAKAERRDPT